MTPEDVKQWALTHDLPAGAQRPMADAVHAMAERIVLLSDRLAGRTPRYTRPPRAEARALAQGYGGWRITKPYGAPVTGQWRAERSGVCMGANDWPMLKRMIDTRRST